MSLASRSAQKWSQSGFSESTHQVSHVQTYTHTRTLLHTSFVVNVFPATLLKMEPVASIRHHWMVGWTDGQKDRWMYGWTDGQTDHDMERWAGRSALRQCGGGKHAYRYLHFEVVPVQLDADVGDGLLEEAAGSQDQHQL